MCTVLKLYLKGHGKLTPNQLIAGYRDTLGKNSRMFSKIASEGKQLGRYDN